MLKRFHRIRAFLPTLFSEVDASSIAVFRIVFGFVMVWETYRYFTYNWARLYWVETDVLFPYVGFGWIKPWLGQDVEILLFLLGVAAFCIAVGLLYRISTIFFFLGFTYLFLLDSTRFLNHFYLICLISFLFILIPAHRTLSLDRFFFQHKRHYEQTVPLWSFWMLRIMVAIPYIYGGISKFTPDWLRGYPLTHWMAAKADLPLVGPLLAERWMGVFFSYGGLIFDLVVVPLLLYRKTRWPAYIVLLFFNLTNAVLFQIGIFPWLMMAASLIFFPPDWPKRFLSLFGSRHTSTEANALSKEAPTTLTRSQYALSVFLAIFLTWQLLFPFRHFLYPGRPHWTREGARFAWHMKLNESKGYTIFHVRDPETGETWKVDPSKNLPKHQYLATFARPRIMQQFAHIIRERHREEFGREPEVYVESLVSLNGREARPLIDPEVNLAAEPISIWPASWILPLDPSLKPS